jgi:ribonuclease R
MPDLLSKILHAVSAQSYIPIKAKALAKRLGIAEDTYPEFRKTVRELIRSGRLALGRNQTIRAIDQHGTITGVYRRTQTGHGFVRPHLVDGIFQPEVFIRENKTLDAATGDEVLARITRLATRTKDAAGEIVRVLERATKTFVGTYFERDGTGLVRIDGTVFAHSIVVGDPGAKGAKPQDKVVVEMLRFPTTDHRGEGVIVEVLGANGEPGVDTLSVIRALGLPEAFPEPVLVESRQVASRFSEDDLAGREDFTHDMVVTIDPADARDFDDAVSVTIDPKTRHWVLTVHIADVGAFVKPGGALDIEARKRATSVYLPQRVLPMFPELISNGLASLQEGKLRYVKTVQIEFTPGLQKGNVRFANGAIRNRRRFTYEQVQTILESLKVESETDKEAKEQGNSPSTSNVKTRALRDEKAITSSNEEREIIGLIERMRDLALLLHKKRLRRGSLELSMPEAVLEYDDRGRVSGAHFAAHDLSHQIIEEFMLAANEAVAEHFTRYEIPFLRRVHPAPNEEKLVAFAQFSDLLGYPIKRPQDRFELQRVLRETADKPERAAVHFSLLRSLKQAVYSPIQDQHYALASVNYCHFTSPIRRYPDLQVHRMLDRWIKDRTASADLDELIALGNHCSKMERRAETAERELIKLKILTYLSGKLGDQLDAVITGVADYGFFAQAERFPAEGLVHISSLVDDHYWFDETSHTLEGSRTKRRFRLGDRVRVEVARVDISRRLLDLRLAGGPAPIPKANFEKQVFSGDRPYRRTKKKRKR